MADVPTIGLCRAHRVGTVRARQAKHIQPFFDELEDLARDEELMGSDKVIKDPNSGALRSVFKMHELSPRFDALTRDAQHPMAAAGG